MALSGLNRTFLAGLAAALLALAAHVQAQQPQRGVDISADCAPCHGNEGIAKDRDVPNLAGQNEGYLYNQLKAFHSGKRPHREMKLLSRPLTDAEMRAIASYFSDLPAR